MDFMMAFRYLLFGHHPAPTSLFHYRRRIGTVAGSLCYIARLRSASTLLSLRRVFLTIVRHYYAALMLKKNIIYRTNINIS